MSKYSGYPSVPVLGTRRFRVPGPGTGPGGYPVVTGYKKMRTGINHIGSISGSVPVPKTGTHFRCSPLRRTVQATKEEVVNLTNNLSLGQALYVPNLNCNLISVSQLNDGLRGFLQFSNNTCAIHDHHSRELIGIGEIREWTLLCLRDVVDASNSFIELSHKCLGHPLEKISKDDPFN